jgi:TonB family protein
MMHGRSRAAITAGIVIVAVAAFGRLGGAQEIVPRPTPTQVRCARPNIAASVVHAVEPDTPPIAQQQGIAGQVQVAVSLDADSRVVGTRIQSSPSAILNAAALAAARQSTFQTEIRDCRPLAADIIFVVDFMAEPAFSTTSSGEQLVTVVGQGTVTRPPDAALVQARISTRADTPAAATTQNAAAFDALKAKLGALGIGGSKIRAMSSGLAESPTRVPGQLYLLFREVEITVDSVSNAGHAAAAAASVASVDPVTIRYTLNNRTPVFRQALDAALKDAEKGARDAAASLRMHLGVVKQVIVVPDNRARPIVTVVPYHLVPVVGGFKELDVRIPDLEVHASATVTYALKR